MAKHSNQAKKQAREAALQHISQPGILANLDIGNPDKVNAFVKQLDSLLGISDMKQGYPGLERQIRLFLDLTRNNNPLIYAALTALGQRYSERLKLGTATHQEKRSLIYRLNIAAKQPRAISDFISRPLDMQAPLGSFLNPKLVFRKRDMTFGPSICTVLADTRCCPNSRDFVCDEASGFYVVEPDESVLFLDKDELGNIIVLLAVLRQIFGGPSNEQAAILEWLQHTVDVATEERRNVRPGHPGKMVQVGYNAGPRHAHVFGCAKSYNKNLDETTKINHDHDVIAAVNIVWAASKAWLPTDITDNIETHLCENNLPRIATRNIPAGTGFQLELGGQKYSFPQYERAPPEAYLTKDYSASLHEDTCWIPGPSAMALTVGRTVDPPHQGPSASPGISSQCQTRSASAISASASEDYQLWPTGGGGNFVDMSLKVIVKQATSTLIAFDPTKAHGTTRLCNAHNQIAAITFSRHIYKAFQKAAAGIVIDTGEGAGDGNFD
ncbi:hypothetical protein K438DRAFT_1925472 [Mycena galopus ATCC 62051]|nr:hypothetical protein K438DRAFT_1925472 [Mycena galopus ATCC 62051]